MTDSKSLLARVPYVLGKTAVLVVIVLVVIGFVISANLARDGLMRERQPVIGSPEDFGASDYEEVTITTSDGIDLVGWVVPSSNGAFVILAHGHGGNRESLFDIAPLFFERGYGLAMFDFRAHGDSGGDLSTIGGDEVLDVIAILDYLETRDDAEPGRVGAVGFSMGAASVARAAALDERLAVVSVEASFSSLREVLLHRADVLGPVSQLATLYTANRLGLDPDGVQVASELCDISPRPIYLVYGDSDTTMNPETPQIMDEASCEPSELWVVEDLEHVPATNLQPEEYEERIGDFFDAALLTEVSD